MADVIGRTVSLRRSGSALVGPCAIHGSRPSARHFSVRGHGWRCFSCGATGDLFSWLQWRDASDFPTAVRTAAGLAGIDLPGQAAARDPAAAARRRAAAEARIGAWREREAAKAQVERDRATAAVRRLWDASVPLDGTLGETYLTATRGLSRPTTGWPNGLRYHPPSNALIAAMTGPHRHVQAVHRTYLTAAADNARDADGNKRKRGRGPQDNAWLNMLGAGPVLLHGEGLETCLSAAIATGFEARALFGRPGDRAQPQPGRINLLLIDDDDLSKQGNRLALVKLRDRVQAWRAEGLTIVLALPYAERRGHGGDFNDLLREAGIDGVRRRIANVLAGDPPAPRPTPEPPLDWEVAHPLREAAAASPRTPFAPGTTALPAFYPPVEHDLDTALALQSEALLDHLGSAHRIAEARRELHRQRAVAIEEAGGEDALTPAEKATITKRLHRQIAAARGFGRRIPLPPWRMIAGGQGTGKTTTVRRFVASSPGSVVMFGAPTTAKAAEEFDAYRHDTTPTSPPALLVRGRAQPDPQRPGHRMCDRSDSAERLASVGLSVTELLCPTCPSNGSCGDHRQRREARELVAAGNGAVFFCADSYAMLPRPFPQPAHIVLDDLPLLQAVDVREVPVAELELLHVPSLYSTTIDISEALRTIVDAITTPHPTTPARVAAGDDRIIPRTLAALRYAGIDRHALAELAKAAEADLDRQTPNITAAMDDRAIEDALYGGNRRQLRNVLMLLSALRTEIDIPREEATGIWLRKPGIIGISRLLRLRGIAKAAVTVLDGTGGLELHSKIFGDRLDAKTIRFPRKANVTGSIGKLYSRQSITARTAKNTPLPSREMAAARLRGEIRAIADTWLPTTPMVAGTKAVENTLLDTGAFDDGTPSTHFGAARGRNAWEHQRCAIIIGAENPSIDDVEAMARATIASDPAPFVSMAAPAPADWRYFREWPYRVTRMRRMANGALFPVDVPAHPDPRVQAVLELIREDEVAQTFDRLRPVWHHRDAVLLNDLVIDVDYTSVRTHRQLVQGGTPLERAYRATGFVPQSPADLHRAHPGIFRSAAAAEHALRNYRQTLNGSLIWNSAVVSYRRIGQRGPLAQACLDRSRYPEDNATTIAKIEAAIGLLQSFQGVAVRQAGDWPDGPSTLRPPEPSATPEPPPQGRGAAPSAVWVHGPPSA